MSATRRVDSAAYPSASRLDRAASRIRVAVTPLRSTTADSFACYPTGSLSVGRPNDSVPQHRSIDRSRLPEGQAGRPARTGPPEVRMRARRADADGFVEHLGVKIHY